MGLKSMRSLRFVIGAAALVASATPAVAQLNNPDSAQFIEAVQKRDGNKATQLLENHPTIVDARDNKGDTALIIAVGRGDRDWTGFLLTKGADPNLPGAHGETPLI